MSTRKKEIRVRFNTDVFERDGYKCKLCPADAVDAHHITDRNEMPNGGYVKENGISLCAKCHEEVEMYHQTGVTREGLYPDDLYKLINSSKELAIKASYNI